MLGKSAVVLVIFAVSLCTYAEPYTVLGDDNFAPFSYVDDNGEIRGIDVDLVRILAKRLDVEFDIKLVPWKRLLLLTKTGQVFGGFSLFSSAEREKFSLFTYPLHHSTFKLFTTGERKFTYNSLQDLTGKKIGIEAGFSLSESFDQAAREGRFELIELFSYEDTFRRLLNGGIHAFLGNDLVVQYQLAHHFREITDIKSLDSAPLIKSKGAFLVISKAYKLEKKDEWRQKIIGKLTEMDKDGTFNDVVMRYTQ